MKTAFFALILGFSVNSISYADCYQVRGLTGTPASVCNMAWSQIATDKCSHYESYAPMWEAGVRRTPLENNEFLYTINLNFNHDNLTYAVPMKIIYNATTGKSAIDGYCCGYNQCEGNIKW